MRLKEIAKRLGCALEGYRELEITGVAGIEAAGAKELTFLANRKYRRAVETTRAGAILVDPREELPPREGMPGLAVLRSENPYLDFARAIEFFYEPPTYAPGVHATAVVAKSAKIGAGAHLGPFCFVDEGVTIGKNAVLHSFVSIYREAQIGDDFFAHSHAVVRERCQIGNRVTLQNSAVVGGDGFGFARQADGTWFKMRQAGVTVIEDDVEIQANACMDRATIGETRIRRGAKIDDLVLVGHASQVGEDTLLCGQVGLAGSTRVGSKCILAGQVGAAGHLEIGEGTVITSQSGVPNDVPAGAVYSGYPAVENREWLKSMAVAKHLPELQRKVKELEEAVEKLKARA